MAIVTFSEALIKRLTANDRRILRDRICSGFCLRLNKRSRTFMVATSSKGKQVRITIGNWPLISVDEARSIAIKILLDCREGKDMSKSIPQKLPSIREMLPAYARAKGIKASSLMRYESILRTHFDGWQDCGLSDLNSVEFSNHCHEFAQSKGAAIVEVGRGLITALIRYANAVFGLKLVSPFNKLAAAGLMPDRAEPRIRRLQKEQLPVWYTVVQSLGAKQRDLLMLLALTGFRRNEGWSIRRKQVDLNNGVLHIPDTKTSQPHSMPLTPHLRELLTRNCEGLDNEQLLFEGVSAEHLSDMAERAGAPKFMLHDLRKMLATTGEHLGFSDAILRRILNHKAKKSDTLHRHYVQLSVHDIHDPLMAIQERLLEMMHK